MTQHITSIFIYSMGVYLTMISHYASATLSSYPSTSIRSRQSAGAEKNIICGFADGCHDVLGNLGWLDFSFHGFASGWLAHELTHAGARLGLFCLSGSTSLCSRYTV